MHNEKLFIESLVNNDRMAYTELIEKYKNMVYTLCFNMLKDKHMADDVAQESFVKVFKSIKNFKHDAKLSTWIYRITYRTCIDHLRKNKVAMSNIDDHYNIQDGSNHGQALEKKDLYQWLKQMIMELPQEEANVLQLFYHQQKSLKEVVAITGLTETNVKTKLFRSRKFLRQRAETFFKHEIELI